MFVIPYDDLKDFIIVLIDTGARAEELLQASAKDFQYFRMVYLNLYRSKTNVDSNIGLKSEAGNLIKTK